MYYFFKSAIVATGRVSCSACSSRWLHSELCVDDFCSLPRPSSAPARRPRRASSAASRRPRPFRLGGHDHRSDAPELDRRRTRTRPGMKKQFRRARITLQLEKQCKTGSRRPAARSRVHFGEGETVEADLVSSRSPARWSMGSAWRTSASSSTGARASPRTASPHDVPTSTPWATAPATRQLAHTAFREGKVAAENAMATTPSSTTAAVRARSTREPGRSRRRPTRRMAREQYGDDVAVGRFPMGSRTRRGHAGRDGRAAKLIGDPRSASPGSSCVSPHVTVPRRQAGHALDAEATVGDGRRRHGAARRSEAIKEAGLVALGRPRPVVGRRGRQRPDERRPMRDPDEAKPDARLGPRRGRQGHRGAREAETSIPDPRPERRRRRRPGRPSPASLRRRECRGHQSAGAGQGHGHPRQRHRVAGKARRPEGVISPRARERRARAGKPSRRSSASSGWSEWSSSPRTGPVPPFPAALEAIERTARESNRYPDGGSYLLRAALADRHGVRFKEDAVGAGADRLIDCVSQATLDPATRWFAGWPSFASYVIDALKLGPCRKQFHSSTTATTSTRSWPRSA